MTGLIGVTPLNVTSTSIPNTGDIFMNSYILNDLGYGVIGTDSVSLG